MRVVRGARGVDFGAKNMEAEDLVSDFSVFEDFLFRRDPTL